MKIPGFGADASLNQARPHYAAALAVAKADRQKVIPQFCWCDCRLYRFCIHLPPYGIPYCYYREYCIPHGNCPPGYCGAHGSSWRPASAEEGFWIWRSERLDQ
jgi:hypothetical protein